MATGRVPTTANSPLTAKGDLFTYSTAPARLAVGNNGESLVADSAATTGLRYTALFGANKNKLLNGDFLINQRAFASATTSGYTFDRWRLGTVGGTCTATPQVFTPGTAPVAGYEGTNFLQIVTSGQSATSDLTFETQRIEDVRIFANQTITVSFWAKANTGTPKIAVGYTQNFGSGGSAAVTGAINQSTISTSWARYSVSATIPAITGKTIGTSSYLELEFWVSAGSDYNARTGSLGIQSNTFQIWGVQAEAGSVATAFQTATGTIQGELAACQRYYFKHSATGANSPINTGSYYTSTNVGTIVPFPVLMRVAPTFSVATGSDYYQAVRNGGLDGFNSFTQDSSNASASILYNNTEASGTAGHAALIIANNASASIAWSAEL